jgi:hypothetical protein
MVQRLDLLVLALALPVFLVADLPMVGYAVAAGAWLVQRAIHLYADRRAAADLASGDRRGALGVTAATTLGRVWLLALAILLVGKFAEREDGLAAAVLAAVLVTAYFAGQLLSHMSIPEKTA